MEPWVVFGAGVLVALLVILVVGGVAALFRHNGFDFNSVQNYRMLSRPSSQRPALPPASLKLTWQGCGGSTMTADYVAATASGTESSVVMPNVLAALPVRAETQAYSFDASYTNSSTGQVETRTGCYVTVPAGFTTEVAGSYPVYFFFHGTSPTSVQPAQTSCQQLVGSGAVCICLLGSELVSDTGTVYSWDVKNSTGTYTTGADDLSLVQTVWNAIKDDARLDTARVYACGHSVGSLFISNELAPLTDFFAGHLCLSSQLLTTTDISSAQSPINVVTIHGKGDKLIPYLGGLASFDENINFMSEVDTLAAWSEHNGCSASLGLTTSTGTFDYTFAAKGTTTQQTVVANWTKYESPCTSGRVCGYILSSPDTSNILVDNIQHNTIDPAMQLFGVSNTAALVLAVFEGELV